MPTEQVPQGLVDKNSWLIENGRVEITTQQVEETISLLIAEQVSLDGLQVKSPNLDDLFLKLTGHSLRE